MRVSVRRGAKELGHSGRGDEAGTQARVQGLGGNVPPNTHHMLEKPRGTTPPADPKASFHQQGREGEPRPRSVRRPNPGRRKTEEREKAPNIVGALAWRISIIVTAALFLITVTDLKRLYWDAPTAKASTWHVRDDQDQQAILDYTALLLLVLTRSWREQPVGHAFQDLIGSM